MNKQQIENFTGIAKQYGDAWWAMCDQLPVAAHGSTYHEAVQAMIGSIRTYRGFLNGHGLPQIPAVTRDEDSLPFEVKLAHRVAVLPT